MDQSRPIVIGPAWLSEVSLDQLPPPLAEQLVGAVYSTLEMRVGMSIAERLSDAQLDEFEALIDNGDEERALAWLEVNVPHYRELVREHFDELTSEIRAQAPALLAELLGSERGGVSA